MRRTTSAEKQLVCMSIHSKNSHLLEKLWIYFGVDKKTVAANFPPFYLQNRKIFISFPLFEICVSTSLMTKFLTTYSWQLASMHLNVISFHRKGKDFKTWFQFFPNCPNYAAFLFLYCYSGNSLLYAILFFKDFSCKDINKSTFFAFKKSHGRYHHMETGWAWKAEESI